ncbi:MAG TPA: hypothetical protein VHS31_12315 [Tepidisphaeraceae bacterium]|jgi:hypothetical protein|nr:hypothetical protein [Tepidisphaeraceae bacterium]
MMAKMFYTLEETKAALQKNEEEIKQLAREGRLREFRDGPRLMFKADQVESIKSELGLGGSTPDIGISDTGAPIGLVDSRGASGTGISLSDTDPGARSGSTGGIALAGTGTGTGMPLKDDTALAADLGLSGSMGGVPSPGRPGGASLSGGTAAGRSGVSVLTADDTETADPSAQTNIASNVPDQVNLDAVGSGSGLLDLTRESDDTSLGAELLDEIAPGTGSKSGGTRGGSTGSGAVAGSLAGGTAGGTAVAEPAISSPRGVAVAGGMMYEQPDPLAPAFAGAAFGASIFVIYGGLALTAAVLSTKIPLVTMVQEKNLSLWALVGIGAGVSVLFAIIGFIAGKR